MSHSTIHRYEPEIVEEGLQHEVTYESRDQKGREKITMHQLLGWGTSRSDQEWAHAPAMGSRSGKTDGGGKGGKRKTFTIPFISRLSKCFRDDTSLEKSRTPSCRMVTASESEGHCSSMSRTVTEVEKVHLSCNRETGQHHDRKKLIDSIFKSKISRCRAEEESGGVTSKHIKKVCDIVLDQQKPVPRSRSRVERDPGTLQGTSIQSEGKLQSSSPAFASGPHRRSPPVTSTEKKEILFSPKQLNASRMKDLEATAARSKECPPPSSRLQKSSSFLDYFGAERRAATESQAKQREDDLGVVFHEIEGESPHHRKHRYQSFKDFQYSIRARRIIEAMHQQEEARQRERDQKTKASKEFDPQIQKWSQGNEGNLRALLSTLQNVLLPNMCTNWTIPSLSDLLTPGSVKKAYRKASYSLHPDKVQQRGGTVEEKYVAEEIFGVLNDAWNKFCGEEKL